MTTAWRQIWILYGAGIAASYQIGKMPMLADALSAGLGLTLAGVGWAMSLLQLAGVAVGPMAGGWADRIGARRAVLIGLAAMALAAASEAMAPNGSALLALRALEGVGYLVVVVAAPTLVVHRSAPADRPVTLTLWGTYVPVGIALAMAVSGLLDPFLGWRGLFALAAAVPVLAALAVMAGVAPQAPARDARGGGARIYRAPGPMLLALGFAAFTLSLQAFLVFLPAQLTGQRGLSPALAGMAGAIGTLAAAAGTILAGRAMARGASLNRLAVLGLLVPAALSSAVFLPGSPNTAALAGAVLFMGIGGLVPAAVFAGLPVLAAPSQIAPANGLIVQTGNLGSLLGPPVIAAWVGTFGWPSSPLLFGTVALAGMLCVNLAFGRRPALSS